MRKMIAGVLAILLLMMSGTTIVFAAENNEQTPSGIAYHDLGKQIEDYIEVRKETTSSVSVTVFNGTNDIATVIYGDANTKDNIKADEDAVYEWGSISKMLVWTSVMQLYEQEKIDLNADVRTYLPDGFLSKLSYKEPITMLHLMNHTAGFQETVWDVETTDKEKIISLKGALLSTAPAQIYEPGTVVSYSNWGAALAAYIVECVSGMDYADYVHKNIFEPLGMEHTAIKPDCSDNTWVENQRKKTNAYYNVQGEYEDYGECRRYILLYPAGSATGTMSDLVRFAKAFLQDSSECPLFTQADTLSVMLSPTLTFSGTDTPRICHGLFSQRYGVSLIGHAGNTTGFSANLVLDTEGGTGMVVMTNEVGETTYNYGLVSLVYGDCKEETGFTYDDISGIYLNSRANYKSSFTKLYSMISGLLPISKGETEGTGLDTSDALGLADRAMVAVADSAAFYDRSLEETTESLQSFLKGNYENDAALGLSCTEITRNEAANKLYGKSFQDLSEAQKQLTLLQMVEDANKLSGAMGQAARESDTWTNQTGNLKQAWKDFQAALGQNVLPLAVDVVKRAAEFVQDLSDKIKNSSSIFEGFSSIISDIVAKIQAKIPEFVALAGKIMTEFGESIKSNLPTVVTKALDMIEGFVDTIAQNLPTLIQSGVEMLKNIAQGIADAIPTLIERVPAIVSKIANLINDNAPTILAAGVDIIITLGKGLVNAIPTLIENIPQIIQAIWDSFCAFNWINLGKQLISGIKSGVTNAASSLKDAVHNIFNGIKDKVSNLSTAAKNVATNIWNLLKSGVSNIVSKLKTFIVDIWNNIKSNTSNVFNGIKSVASTIWNGIKSLISGVVDSIKSKVSSVFNEIKSIVTTVLDAIKSVISSVFNAIKSTISSILNSIKSVFSSVWNGIKSTVSSVVNGVKSTISSGLNAAKNTVSNVLNSIKSKFSSIFESAKSIVSNAINKIKSFFNFSWSLPKIKLPHFSISGKFSLNPPSIPHFSVSWYKKAMDEPYMFTKPTLFDVNPATGTAKGAGEAGDEVMIGKDTMLNMIRQAVAVENSATIEKLNVLLDLLSEHFPKIEKGICEGKIIKLNEREVGRVVKEYT